MKCEFCSSPIAEGSTHCPGCGAPAPQPAQNHQPGSAPDADPNALFSELYSPDRPSLGRVEEPAVPPVVETAKPTDLPPHTPVTIAPLPPKPGNPRRNGFAIASIILSIVSTCAGLFPCCTLPLPVIAIILGAFGLKSQQKTLAMLGIAIGVVGLLVSIGVSISFLTSSEFAQIWQGN
jgi:hypothetical protein